MAKKTFCPHCKSNKIKYEDPQLSIWKCRNCGYQGSIVIENGNVDKNVKNTRKMDKLTKRLSWKK